MPASLSRVGARLPAGASAITAAALPLILAAGDQLPARDALWIAASILAGFLPSGWATPHGWRRRLAEASLLPVAIALLLVADLTMRRMILPPLLVAAAAAAVLAAVSRERGRRRPLLWAAFGVAARAAGGLGLVGAGPFGATVALAASAVVPAAAATWGRRFGLLAGLAVACVPAQRWPVGTLVAMLLVVGTIPWGPSRRRGWAALDGWLPAVAAAALIGSALAPYGGIELADAFPTAGPAGLAVVAAAALVVLRLPPAAAGALWMVVALAIGPAQRPSADRPAFRLGADAPAVQLPAGLGGEYLVDLGLRGGEEIEPATTVAIVETARGERTLRAGIEVAERARHGARGRPLSIAHGLPEQPLWRPIRIGSPPAWRVSGRTELDVAAGEQPTLRRAADLPSDVTLVVEAAGPSVPTAPRSLGLVGWLWGAAAVVLLLQIGSRGWQATVSLLPWAVLVAGQLAARIAVEPLRLLAERHAVDLAMAAVLAAWVPAAWRWLRSGRASLATATLLVPLAVATPLATPPLYGDEPFHLHVMESLARDHDLDLANNLDVERHPGDGTYTLGNPLLHSPVLGMLLLPGWIIAGRTGALVLLALAGAGVMALLARRARQLGVPGRRRAVLLLGAIVTYPLATFATQIWPELPGALALAAILVTAAAPSARPGLAVAMAALAAAIKTRLGLVTFPAAAAAWLASRRRFGLAGAAAIIVAAVASLAIGWLFMGHPFGFYRRLPDLVPADPTLALRVLAGLAFDPAGGMLFTAPLMLIAVPLLRPLWVRGGPGERAALLGGALTLLGLLHSAEWYGGGAPPARYLVVLLPVVVLAWGIGLTVPLRWRRLGEILLAPSVLMWWVLVTRPHLSINPGDGRWWLSDALARRFAADPQHLVPSFLVPTPATFWLPPLVVVLAVAVATVASRRPAALRLAVRCGTAFWLVLAVAVSSALALRHDVVVEAEAAQVRRLGGAPVPPAGTFSRYAHRRGWLVRNGDGIVVPLSVGEGASVRIEGWLLGTAQRGAVLVVRWDDLTPVEIRVAGTASQGRVRAPDPPGAGRHELRIVLRAPPGGGAVLDRLVVEP